MQKSSCWYIFHHFYSNSRATNTIIFLAFENFIFFGFLFLGAPAVDFPAFVEHLHENGHGHEDEDEYQGVVSEGDQLVQTGLDVRQGV